MHWAPGIGESSFRTCSSATNRIEDEDEKEDEDIKPRRGDLFIDPHGLQNALSFCFSAARLKQFRVRQSRWMPQQIVLRQFRFASPKNKKKIRRSFRAINGPALRGFSLPIRVFRFMESHLSLLRMHGDHEPDRRRGRERLEERFMEKRFSWF